MSDKAEQGTPNVRHVLDGMLRGAALSGAQLTNMNTNQLIPLFVEYVVFQMFLLAPLEVEEWMKQCLEQCKTPDVPMPRLLDAREDLTLTLEMVTNT
jgi:hypothetical protein